MLHKKRFSWGLFASQRFIYSRYYAGRRFGDAALPKRAAASLASLALPPLLLIRAVQAARRKGLGREMWRASPHLLAFYCIWARRRERGRAARPRQSARDDRVTGFRLSGMPLACSRRATGGYECALLRPLVPSPVRDSRLSPSRRSLSVARGRAREGGAAARICRKARLSRARALLLFNHGRCPGRGSRHVSPAMSLHAAARARPSIEALRSAGVAMRYSISAAGAAARWSRGERLFQRSDRRRHRLALAGHRPKEAR